MKCVETKPCKAFKTDKIKFETSIHLILDVFPPVFWLKIICITTSHLSGVMVNTTFSVMDEVIRGFKPGLNLYIRIVLYHKHSCALKSLFVQNTSSITNFLFTSLTTCYEVKN